MPFVQTVDCAGAGAISPGREASQCARTRTRLSAAATVPSTSWGPPGGAARGRGGPLRAGGLLPRGDGGVVFGGGGGGGFFRTAGAGPPRGGAVGGPPLALVARKDGSVCTVTAGGEPVRLACFTG